MAPKQPCPKYQYIVTASGPKILAVDEPAPKDEESPADYNMGGYLPIKVNDTFSGNRYRVVRKLGCALMYPVCSLSLLIVSPDGVIFQQFGSLEMHCANLSLPHFLLRDNHLLVLTVTLP